MLPKTENKKYGFSLALLYFNTSDILIFLRTALFIFSGTNCLIQYWVHQIKTTLLMGRFSSGTERQSSFLVE
jgi:hypothetical protein